jgi:hypothetical protein
MALLQKAYLGATPLFREQMWYETPNSIVSSASATVTANTSAHTKGAWQEIIASTAADTSLIHVHVTGINQNGTNTATLLDIATGASGSETAITSNIAVGAADSRGIAFAFPYKLPSGTRLSARIQSVVTGGKTATVEIFAIDQGDYATSPTSVDVIGGNTANSEGISFSGASGTWVEGISSTSRAYRAVVVVASSHSAAILNTNQSFEIGIGAASSEVSFGTVRYNFTNAEQAFIAPPQVLLFGRNIPAGSRLAVKHNFASGPSNYGFNLIGIP